MAWILKRALGRAGVRDLDRDGAHSPRAGFATTAFDNGVPEFKIRQQTGHKTSRSSCGSVVPDACKLNSCFEGLSLSIDPIWSE